MLAVLDPYWLDFLEQKHAQRPVRLAWRPDRLQPLAWHQQQLTEQGWELHQVLSELRLDRKDVSEA